jgi:hypothetical protein
MRRRFQVSWLRVLRALLMVGVALAWGGRKGASQADEKEKDKDKDAPSAVGWVGHEIGLPRERKACIARFRA